MEGVTGSVFRKVDLHIHTPKSMCYSDKSVTTEQIVDAALAGGLETIAVTDHGTFAAVDEIRQIAGEKGLFVFPGVELTTRAGHLLGIFELDTSVEKLEDFLDDIHLDRGARGDGTMMAGDGMEEILEKIVERGGIAILAHIERWPSGFLESNESRQAKIRIHASKYLSALEITVPQNRPVWNAGQMRDFPKKYACVQGSDAHSLSEIGRRPVYIQMDEVSLEALGAAFLDYETKIVFPGEPSLGE